jgi:hypothetical protein
MPSQRTLTPAMRASRAAKDIGAARHLLAPLPAHLVQLWCVDAVQPDQLVGQDDGVAIDDLGGNR